MKLPKIILAPLAGYTNSAFRRICNELGIKLTYSEMVSVKGLYYDSIRTKELCYIDELENDVCIQLFGGEVEDFIKGANVIKDLNYFSLDVNAGCPVKKVLKTGGGSRLLEDLDKLKEIIYQLKLISKKYVSVKIRAGLNKSSISIPQTIKKCEEAGVDFIAVHGRCASDLYKGCVNLDYIKLAKEVASVPIIGNGDIRSIDDAINMFNYTKCDSIMVGRGALTNPFLLRDLIEYFENGNNIRKEIKVSDRLNLIMKHIEYLSEIKPEKIVILEMKSIANFYLKHVNNCKEYKVNIVKSKNINELIGIIDSMRKLNENHWNGN